MKSIAYALVMIVGSVVGAQAAGCAALEGTTTWDSLRW